MPKTQKFDDVKQPNKVTPSATARPIIVGNHAMLAKDPMMAPTGDTQPADSGEPATPSAAGMTHEKTIAPISIISVKSDEDKGEKPEEPKEAEAGTKPDPEEKSAEPTRTDPPEPTEAASDPESKPESQEPESGTKPDEPRDPEAETTSEEAAVAEAKAKREQELEDIVTSGKYAVPIDAVQRRRSRIATTMLVVLAVLLAIVLVDAILDVGILHVSSSVPHTHFFSKK
jgi:hypothetical protein